MEAPAGDARLSSVRELTFELLRRHAITTIFGNPGSNELPFLRAFPDDFVYVHALHEGVALSMADGYAQATGRPALVNLHSAAGTGNAMGALVNAAASHTPLVVTAGQQARPLIGIEAFLTNVDATVLPRPLVKAAFEPVSALDVVRTFSHAIHLACTAPRGPVFVSIPYDDWDAAVDAEAAGLAALAERSVSAANRPDDGAVGELVARLRSARRPLLVAGADVDASGALGTLVEIAERLDVPVALAPRAGRCSFPTRHRLFAGALPPAIGPLAKRLEGHDLVVVLGAPVFRYHANVPGPYLPSGTRVVCVTSDPAEAARAPVGDALVADVAATLAAVLAVLAPSGEPRREPTRAATAEAAAGLDRAAVGSPNGPLDVERLLVADRPLDVEGLLEVIDACAPDDVVYVNEATSIDDRFVERVRIDGPGGYYFPAAGSLGFGLPAAVGIQLADPERPVIAVVGDGSANYAVTALWTAARHHVPVVFVIVDNGTYGALRRFAEQMGTGKVPGLDLDGIDFVALASAYGVPASRATTRDQLATALREALAGQADRDGPVLIDAVLPRL